MSSKLPEELVPPKSESGGCCAIVRLVNDFEAPEVT
jgi:hypothetical protein